MKDIHLFREACKGNFEGTIIDIETIGEFRNCYGMDRYRDIRTVIFGVLNANELKIHYVRGKEDIGKLHKFLDKEIASLERPFYAFNTEFESTVLFHNIGKWILFERELNREKYEAKRNAIAALGISNYSDPFNDNGLLCKEAWIRGDFKNAITHNRACLLKEKDILLKRGYRNGET